MRSVDSTHQHEQQAEDPATHHAEPGRLPRRISRKAAAASSPALVEQAATAWSFADAVNAGIHAPLARAAAGGEVGAGAEAAVASAATSTGSALPAVLQRKFEGSLGVDLSGVRVHTGQASAEATGAVAARAYATGQDIHFGAGQYDPSSRAGEHLIAHEVAHTVQQRGGVARAQFKLEVTGPGDACEHEADAAADAMVSGQAFAVGGAAAPHQLRRNPLFPEGFSVLADAQECDWQALPPRLPVPAAPPDFPSVQLSDAPPGHEPNGGWLESRGLEAPPRQAYWAAFRDSFGALHAAWDAMRPHVMQFNLVREQDAETLRGATADMRIPGGTAGDGTTMGDHADRQHPGVGSTPNPVSVSELFGRHPGGEGLVLGDGGTEGIERAGQHMGREFTQIDEVDGQLQAAVDAARGAHAGVEAARHGVEAALSAVQQSAREGEERGARARVQREESSVTEVKSIITLISQCTTLGATQSVASGTALATTIAGRLVDQFAANRLAQARARLSRAERLLATEIDHGRFERYQQARAQLDVALAAHDEARARARAALAARRRAYSDLGDSAGRRSGTDGETRDRIRAMVAAVPLLESVVNHARAVVEACVDPPYSTPAGRGLGIAMASSDASGEAFMSSLATLRGYRHTFGEHQRHWHARLAACEFNVRELRGNHESERRDTEGSE